MLDCYRSGIIQKAIQIVYTYVNNVCTDYIYIYDDYLYCPFLYCTVYNPPLRNTVTLDIMPTYYYNPFYRDMYYFFLSVI